MNAALLARLIEAGTPADLVSEVAMEFARASAIRETLENRKAKDRERKRIPRNSTESEDSLEKGSLEVSPHTPLPKPSQINPLNPPFGFEEKRVAIGTCLKRAYPAKVELPDWMPESYAEFRAMRKSMRNVPFGEGAERRCIAKLVRLRDEGHDPEKLISKAIERGHRTFFEDESTKATGTSRAPLTEDEKAEFIDRMVARLESEGRHVEARQYRAKCGLKAA